MHPETDPCPYRSELQVQLRFTDIDMLGHVNNTVYFQLMDLGKSRYITDVLGAEFDPRGAALAIVNVNCQFQAVSLYDEPLAVRTRVDAVGRHSVTFVQQVVNSRTGQVKCECRTVMAGFDVSTGSGMEIPAVWRALLGRHEGREFGL